MITKITHYEDKDTEQKLKTICSGMVKEGVVVVSVKISENKDKETVNITITDNKKSMRGEPKRNIST